MTPAVPQTHYIRISRGGAQPSVFFKPLQVISMGSQVREALIYRKTDGIRTKQKSELLETWRFPDIEAAQTQSGCHVVVMNASLLWMVRLKFTDLKFPPILRGWVNALRWRFSNFFNSSKELFVQIKYLKQKKKEVASSPPHPYTHQVHSTRFSMMTREDTVEIQKVNEKL